MKPIARRLQRLEIAYEEALEKKAIYCYWSDAVLYYAFPKKWPDPEKAPPIALYAYRRMQEYWARRRERLERENPEASNEPTD